MIKLQIKGYSDPEFNSYIDQFDAQINPASFKLEKKVSYTDTQASGEQQQQKFASLGYSTLSFDLILDDTGFIENKEGKIKERISKLESVVYEINGEIHQPNYLRVIWGDFIFQGYVTKLDYDYSLFNPDGSALRVKASLTFTGSKAGKEKKSPDLSRIITLKAGESIAWLCQKYYSDPSYCVDIARINQLSGFRHVKPGTRLLFPPLARDGRSSK